MIAFIVRVYMYMLSGARALCMYTYTHDNYYLYPTQRYVRGTRVGCRRAQGCSSTQYLRTCTPTLPCYSNLLPYYSIMLPYPATLLLYPATVLPYPATLLLYRYPRLLTFFDAYCMSKTGNIEAEILHGNWSSYWKYNEFYFL